MSGEVVVKLAAVVSALDKATPGPWDIHECRGEGDTYLNVTGSKSCASICDNDIWNSQPMGDDDLRAAVAAVNFLREHHADLAALQAKLDAVTKDSERLDFLIEWFGWNDDLEGSGIRDWIDYADARAAIDAALTDQGRAGESDG